MAEYVSIPIETDPDDLAQIAFDYIQERVPDWDPDDPQLDVWLITAISRIAAEVRDVASDVPTSIFRYYGANVIGLTPQDAVEANGTTTWTVKDTAGYTIEAGTVVSIRSDDGNDVAFETTVDVVIQPGSAITATGEVPITAIEPGADGSGLTGSPALTVDLVDQLDYVTAITLTGPTTGGIDPESDEDYLARLTSWLQLLAPRPILAKDFAAYVMQTIPGVERAVAVDNYIPPSNFAAERAVAVAMVDSSGEPVAGGIKTQADAELQSKRELNFIVNVIDPVYANIDVTFAATSYPGWTPADVEARAEAALAEYFNPANWGIPPFGDTRGWINKATVYFSEVYAALNTVEGLDVVTSLTMGKNGGAQTAGTNVSIAADIRIPSLTRPGTIAGTVT